MIVKKIILILIVLGSLSSWSSTCSLYFNPFVLSHIGYINQTNNHFITQALAHRKDGELTFMRKIRLYSLLERIEREGFASEKDLQVSAEKIVLILFGEKDVVDRYFRNQNTRITETTHYRISTQLVEKGLKSFFKNHSGVFKASLWIKLKIQARRFLNSQAWNWLQLPFSLPDRKSKNISEDLMTKVIWDGIPAHINELQSYWGAQSRIDLYQAVKRIYAGVFIGLVAVHGWNVSEQQRVQESHAQAQIVVAQLETFAADLPNAVLEMKNETYKRAFENALAEYRAQEGREPPAEDYETIRRIIYED